MRIPEFAWPAARRLLRLYWRLHRPLTLGVRAVVLNDEGQALLVRHTYMAGWYLPGGGVERGETMAQALRRELAEEVGVTPLEAARLVGLYANFREFKSDHVALFVVRAFSIESTFSREIAESGFFSLDKLPEETSDATRRRLHEVAQALPVPELW